MTKPSPSQLLISHLEWSIRHLEDSLKRETSDYFQNAALQRFRFTFELTLKTLKAHATEQGATLDNKDCVNYALERGWINTLEDWEHIDACYNDLVKTPPQNAKEIFLELGAFAKSFESLYQQMKKDIQPHPLNA
ncbi:MAG: hypothetical protein G3M78_10775 [Candidatus Nitrohelix vancouverensis]|uniref:Nucleotidyltransferase n=1 Tax=Candidatus Nitrohelix vancouverensis TaxID=2705534 RepID=A0A7T0C3I3_9BACT|nr:MAG: hypothetical protein G3M78_10775 [Candidatus Nitrohelix vancouverensis]